MELMCALTEVNREDRGSDRAHAVQKPVRK